MRPKTSKPAPNSYHKTVTHSFDPTDLYQLAQTMKNLVALGEGPRDGNPLLAYRDKARQVREAMAARDAGDDLDEFLSWFNGEGWNPE